MRSASLHSVVVLTTHGQNDCGSAHEEQSGSGSEAGQLGTGARQIRTAVTVSVIVVSIAGSAIGIAASLLPSSSPPVPPPEPSSSATTSNEPVSADSSSVSLAPATSTSYLPR
jgi:hypothetical protein